MQSTIHRSVRVLVALLVIATGLVAAPRPSAAATLTISGTVTDQFGHPVSMAEVFVYGSRSSTLTAVDGSYELAVPAVRTITVRFRGPAGSLLRDRWWNETDGPGPLNPNQDARLDGIDAVLSYPAGTGAVSGQVSITTGASFQVPPFVAVTGPDFFHGTTARPDGSFTVGGLPPGSGYRVYFSTFGVSPANLVAEYHSDARTQETSTPVSVAAGVETIVNATLGFGGSVSGTIAGLPTTPGTGSVLVEALTPSGQVVGSVVARSSAAPYTISGLPSGSYRLRATPCLTCGTLLQTWFHGGVPDIASATPVTLGAQQTVTGVDIAPPSFAPGGHALEMLDEPCLVYSSIEASGGLAGALDGGETRTIMVNGGDGRSQAAYSHNCSFVPGLPVLVTVTADDPVAAGNLQITMTGTTPNGGAVNYAPNGLDNSNTVTVTPSAAGTIDVTANNGPSGQGQPSTHVRVTMLGHFRPATSPNFFPVTPCTIADTRTNQGAGGPYAGPFGAESAIPDIDAVGTFPAAQGGGNTTCGIPADAYAVIVNAVATNTSGGTGHLSAGTGGTTPAEPLVGLAPLGMNNATVTAIPVAAAGTIALDITAITGTPSTNIRLVVVGYLAEQPGGSGYHAVTPCAAFDTRTNQGATGDFAGPRSGGQTTTYQIAGTLPAAQGGLNGGTCNIPATATGVLVNLVAVNALTPGNLQARATGTVPTGGVLNYAPLSPPMNNANAVPLPLDASGRIDITANAGPTRVGQPSSDLRGIVYGYYD